MLVLVTDEGSHAEALQVGHIPRTGEALADRIVTAIAVGEFLPGERLPPERELAELVGVSRSTVRDALARVVSLDLLEIRRGRGGGAFVRHPWGETTGQVVRNVLEPEWKALEQTMDLRHLVEAMVARTAAERRTREDVAAITAALAAYEKPENLRQAQAADVRLHHAVAAAAHNEELLALREELFSKVSLGFVVEPFTQAIYDRALPQHRALAQAIVEGDEATAWDVGKEHFTITADELRATLHRAVSTS
jgi:GntR family transcriptional repressor for pyruvate dehydrogenase complex